MDILVRSFITPVGELLLGSYHGALCLCDWKERRSRDAVDRRLLRGIGVPYKEGTSPVIEQAMDQLNAYFAGGHRPLDVPLHMVGTEFQRRVWEALRGIPYGASVSYAELRDQVTDRTAIRAVAAANGANALSIFIPCHRVLGSDGDLVGYAGGVKAKRFLLELEGALMRSLPGLFDGPGPM